MNTVAPTPIEALRGPANAAEPLATRESEALLTLLDRVAAGEPVPLARLLATAAALRMRLLEAGSAEAAEWWDELAEGERQLHGSLIDALRADPPSTQERVLTYLRELFATGSPAFVPLREPLEQTDLVVAVAGDFKRGKSTLLNALIGRHILPTRVAPATAVPCVLRYAAAIAIRVHYRDGRPAAAIAEEDLEAYACIPRPSDGGELVFRPEIDHLELGIPWSFPRDVALLDLPGLNEEGGRAEMARLAVAGADAVLVVLAATQLLAEDELQFIDSLWSEGQRTLLFAINHLDQLDEQDLALVHERAVTLLAPYGGIMGQTVFLVSARLAGNAIAEGQPPPPESGLPPVLARLERLLGAERAAAWRVGRARQALAALEERDREAGDAVLEQQDIARQTAVDLEAAAADLAAAERAQEEREAAAAHALAMGRDRLADHDRRFEERWDVLMADLEEQSRHEPLPWLWQDAREWLRAETIRAIRDVHPEVTPRPEGYLRIGIPPALRLGREALRAFYREEARREWDRFTAEARHQGREDLETTVQAADEETARLREERAATIPPLIARRAELIVSLAREDGRTRTLIEAALTASEALRAGLEAFVL